MNAALPFFERLRIQGNPVAASGCIVTYGHARFTVLTARLIRLEWAHEGQFEDRSTFAFPNRHGEVPAFSYAVNESVIEIKTDFLTITYREDGKPFHPANLSIRLNMNESVVEWTPGLVNFGNLRGTRRTLDQCADEASLSEGLLSRDGWSLFDDSHSVVWDHDQTWVQGRADEHVYDWYFFGYGRDYKALLREYIRFGGDIPLVPRYVLGSWWSRFWAYHADDLKQLVNDFDSHDVPLDVLVVDMDWHTPDGWTGYTWNKELFPDPEAFLSWVHAQNLYATLNLHPADGIQKHEAAYPEFSRLLGRDPALGEGIAFNSTSKAFIQHYFELLHHPIEEQGIDFWWIDWQQGTATDVKNLDPLPWLNHLHFRDATRRGTRPMLYSRWGGLGNHRYPIGFSGDAYTTWESLNFQPYFTATAANLAYGWWSHDIGGHFGAADPELYARWVQFGAVSPCLRLHSTKDPLAERRPWGFSAEVYEAAKSAMQFRYQLLPYLYSAARAGSQHGLSLCYPMYYDYPDSDDAYLARNQYFLGNQLIAAPIVSPADPETGLAAYDVWIPDGTWFDYHTLEAFTGPCWIRRYGDLETIPLFAKAGAIVPLSPTIMRTKYYDGSHVILNLFPCRDGSFELYEDDGTTEAYQRGEYQITSIALTSSDSKTIAVNISAAQGNYDALPAKRTFELRLKQMTQPDQITVNGSDNQDWSYDATAHELVIFIRDVSRKTPMDVVVSSAKNLVVADTTPHIDLILADASKLLGMEQQITSPDQAFELALQAADPQKAALLARLGGPFVHVVDYVIYDDARQQLGTVVINPPVDGSTFDVEIEWSLLKNGQTSAPAPIILKACTEQKILHSPFNDDGTFTTFRWCVSVSMVWRGQTIAYHYQSQNAYPSITRWRTLIYNPEQQQMALENVFTPENGLNTELEWSDTSQKLDSTPNIKQPYGLILLENEVKRITGGESLAAYAVTTLSSEEAQEVILALQHVGAMTAYLNSVELTATEPIEHSKLQPMFYSWMPPKQPYYKLSLQPGDNQLVIFTQPDTVIGWWGVGATLFDLSGTVIA
jgi:alpha-glucosidase (family GH31 glycosyl hydrolase)